MNNKIIDYELILKDCGFGSSSQECVVKNIANLVGLYAPEDLTGIYNYCLKNINNPYILTQVIRMSDENKAESTMNILLDMLVNFINKEKDFDNNDDIINLRVMCAKAVSNYKDSSAMGALLYCLNNKEEDYKVRLACADALGRIGDSYAVEPLVDVVRDENEKSVYVKESAASALGMIGDISAIEPLIAILESKQAFFDKFTFLKERIVEALGKLNINDKKVMKALKKSLMDSSPLVRINAIEAIMNSNDEDAFILIKPCLSDEDENVRKNALIALYNISGRDILDEVRFGLYPESLKQIALELMREYEEEDD